MLERNKIVLNVIHTQGYEVVKVPYKDLSPIDNYKFGDESEYKRKLSELLNTVSDSDLEELTTGGVFFIRPKDFHNIDLAEINEEEMYLDIRSFVENINVESSNEFVEVMYGGFGKYREDFLELLNKYGWCNWANNPISAEIYNGLPDFKSNFGLGFNQVLYEEKISGTKYSTIYQFLQNLAVAQEDAGLWAALLFKSKDGVFTDLDEDSVFTRNINLRKNNNGRFEIQPLSIGSKLTYFEKVRMPNYSIGDCKFCNKKFINKKGRLFCSNSCKVRSYRSNK